MLIDKPTLARMVPHAGAMCLLDGVLNWDATQIRCVTASHRAVGNPLRRDGQLGILCGVEYAAQAMALHGVLAANDAEHHIASSNTQPAGQPRGGFLASLRGVTCHVARLDLLPGTLFVEAERVHGDAGRAIYRFTLSHQDQALLSGRAAVVLQETT